MDSPQPQSRKALRVHIISESRPFLLLIRLFFYLLAATKCLRTYPCNSRKWTDEIIQRRLILIINLTQRRLDFLYYQYKVKKLICLNTFMATDSKLCIQYSIDPNISGCLEISRIFITTNLFIPHRRLQQFHCVCSPVFKPKWKFQVNPKWF